MRVGVEKPSFMDGHSMLSFLLPQNENNQKGWRTAFLNEYYSVGTYYNGNSLFSEWLVVAVHCYCYFISFYCGFIMCLLDHSNAWEDGKTTTNKCGGALTSSSQMSHSD